MFLLIGGEGENFTFMKNSYVSLGVSIELFYCCMEVCVQKDAYESQRDELDQWLIYCFSGINAFFFVLILILDTVTLSIFQLAQN